MKLTPVSVFTSITPIHSFHTMIQLNKHDARSFSFLFSFNIFLNMTTSLWPEQFHKHVSVRRFDPLVVLFFRFNNFESEFLIEIYGALVIYLNMSNKKK